MLLLYDNPLCLFLLPHKNHFCNLVKVADFFFSYYSINITCFLLLRAVKSVSTLQLEYQLCQICQFMIKAHW